MAAFASIDYHKWQRWAFGLYIGNFLLLGLVMVGGRSALGAQRWINLGPIQFQPSEPAKLVLAICIAALVARRPSLGRRDMGVAIAAVALPALLILKQPDLGTTLVIFAILSAELFFGVAKTWYFLVVRGRDGRDRLVRRRHEIRAQAVSAQSSARVLASRTPIRRAPAGISINRRSRSAAANSSAKGSTTGRRRNSISCPNIRAISSSRSSAKSSATSVRSRSSALYAIVLFGAIRAMLAARDRFGLLLAVGLVAMLAFHITINIGMTVGIMPITGIPLPFVSYGGTAVLTDFAAIGLLLNIYLQRDKLVF